MKTRLNVFLLAFASVVLCSCNKFSSGLPTTKSIHVDENFCVIEINDFVNVTVIHADEGHKAGDIEIHAGEKLIDGIIADTARDIAAIHNDTLTLTKLVIRNNNAFNTFLPYNYDIDLTIYYDSLYKLIFNSNGTLETDTIKGIRIRESDTVVSSNCAIEIEGGSGEINALLRCDKLTTKYQEGTSTVNLAGNVTFAYTSASYNCHGQIHSKGLSTHIHYIKPYYSNTLIEAKAYHMLDVENLNIGEVHYLRYWTTREDHIWNDSLHQTDTIITRVLCPEVIRYNGEYVNIWTYNNDENSIPGLVQDRE